jgi:hypothetical protein
MASTINALTSGGGIALTGDTSGALQLQTNNGTTAVTIDTSQNVGIGTSSPSSQLAVQTTAGSSTGFLKFTDVTYGGDVRFGKNTGISNDAIAGTWAANNMLFYTNSSERMRITSAGEVHIGKTATSVSTVGCTLTETGILTATRESNPACAFSRNTDDGSIVDFYQQGTKEGSISVSGTTVSYNGGHISRWSQLYNETEKVEVYRGTVLESVDALCEWYDVEGNLLPNEQATKTIVSDTASSKKVAGVFDRYDEDDQDNPYDFYVAQSGDFIIRIAEGVVVQNGDLLESAGDGTARPQVDDICRSSTIAKVTSNYVSEIYPDGSYCVPCILMIG